MADEHQRIPITFPPGLSFLDSEDTNNRWIDGDNIRWVGGNPEKIGGNEVISTDPVTGVPRSMIAWDDFFYNKWIAVGTNSKLEVYDNNMDVFNITPWRVFETT